MSATLLSNLARRAEAVRPHERAAIADIPGVAWLRDLSPPFAFGIAPLVLRAVRCLPRRLRYALPVLPVLEARFGER